MWQIVRHDIVPLHFQIRLGERLQKSRVKVSSHHLALRSYPGAKPLGYGASASTDIKTVPSLVNTNGSHTAKRNGVKRCLQHSQTLARLFPGDVIVVTGHLKFLSG